MQILIDGNNLVHRAFYKSGNSFTLFAKIFNSIIYSILKNDYYNNNHKIIWDSPIGYWRKKIYPDYKATRQKMDDHDLFVDFRQKLITYLSNNTNRSQLCLRLFEADDIIANLVNKKKNINDIIIIVSNDTDMYQLLNDFKPMVLIKQIGKRKYYSSKTFRNEFGFEPNLYSSYKSLCGDNSDNIPGVPGIGDKRAKEIIKRYGHLSEWLQKVQPDKDDNISQFAFQARLNYKKVLLYYKLIDLSINNFNIEMNYKNNLYK